MVLKKGQGIAKVKGFIVWKPGMNAHCSKCKSFTMKFFEMVISPLWNLFRYTDTASWMIVIQYITKSQKCLMSSLLVMSNLNWFSPGTQKVPWLIRREWTWHHKSNGDSPATDHTGQSRAHRKCIPSPHSHCPHWCLFKLGFDTRRDYFSTEFFSHHTFASNALKLPISSM